MGDHRMFFDQQFSGDVRATCSCREFTSEWMVTREAAELAGDAHYLAVETIDKMDDLVTPASQD